MSLVADYYSDSSSAGEENEDTLSSVLKRGEGVDPVVDRTAAESVGTSNANDNDSNKWSNKKTKTTAFFGSTKDENGSSEDDDVSSSSGEDKVLERQKEGSSSCGAKGKNAIILENPFRYNLFGGDGSTQNVSAEDSVLRVEFREEAAQKAALMERHVKMSETDGAAQKINGKTVCWQYRKGKCRFGHNCKFAHDSDITNPFGESVPKKDYESTEKKNKVVVPPSDVSTRTSGSESSSTSSSVITFSSSAHLSGERKRGKGSSISLGISDEDEDESNDKKKKKRPGLSATLTPGKKVMGMYYKSKTNQ